MSGSISAASYLRTDVLHILIRRTFLVQDDANRPHEPIDLFPPPAPRTPHEHIPGFAPPSMPPRIRRGGHRRTTQFPRLTWLHFCVWPSTPACHYPRTRSSLRATAPSAQLCWRAAYVPLFSDAVHPVCLRYKHDAYAGVRTCVAASAANASRSTSPTHIGLLGPLKPGLSNMKTQRTRNIYQFRGIIKWRGPSLGHRRTNFVLPTFLGATTPLR